MNAARGVGGNYVCLYRIGSNIRSGRGGTSSSVLAGLSDIHCTPLSVWCHYGVIVTCIRNISLGVGVRNDCTEWRHLARSRPWQTDNLTGLVLSRTEEDGATQAVLWKTWEESCTIARLAPLTLFSGELRRGKLGWLIKWLFTSCLWEAITRKRNMLWRWNFRHATVLR